ncbi:MAG TPA: PVC-type heme-binding CxxCH protein [Methylomirabilota bacterium]|nr:PVC-type heme-binding CxxCH protein [Methylomirabilota bacterium]
MMLARIWAAAVAAGSLAAMAADPFAEGVRPTEPLTPEQQARTFHLPAGFEIQLVASEPQIYKPMNIAFDARGRLWVSDTLEYPFPAKPGTVGRDSIKILEDTNLDGVADKVTTFVDGLNIPIGLYPYKNGVIAWSIPNIWYFEDTDGDNKADKRTVLFGPLGWERDTHGNIASLRRGFDGWLYGTHGFNNESTFRGRDGSELRVQSGNVWRARVDGSRVEPHSFGQVNPFGLAFDEFGNLYSADCHSSPIYQLIRGAYYPSFGKPHDGLGFGPTLMQHSHGSTAIAGIIFYEDDLWPSEYTNNIFVGNVMTSRINRDVMTPFGTTLTAKEMPDFLSTDDPWFRPVDIRMGPEGAMYIADFYNRIIGHYEVSLTHPGRDRTRGRIWRVSYKQPPTPLPAFRDLTRLGVPGLFEEMNSRNSVRRSLALNELADRFGSGAREPLMRLMATDPDTNLTVNALWALHRAGGVPEELLNRVWKRPTPLFQTHVLRVLSETPKWSGMQQQMVFEGLNSLEPTVVRAAADAVAQHDVPEALPLLITTSTRLDARDTHLTHQLRIALRNQLRGTNAYQRLDINGLDENQSRAVANVSLGVANADAARFLLTHIRRFTEEPARVQQFLRHISTHLPVEESVALVDFVTRRFDKDLDLQLELFKALQEGLARRGAEMPEVARSWGERLTISLLGYAPNEGAGWRNLPVEGAPLSANPWRFETRRASDQQEGKYVTSYAAGAEHLTGTLRSAPFRIPAQLTFYIAGHDGVPENPAGKKNYVALRKSPEGTIVRTAPAPRNDVAQKVTWDLNDLAGQLGTLEVVDGDTGAAYAWIAISRIEPSMVRLPEVEPRLMQRRQIEAATLARTLKVTNAAPALNALLLGDSSEMEARAAAALALASFRPNENLSALAPLVGEASLGEETRRRIQLGLSQTNATASLDLVQEVFRTAPQRVQARLAESLASSPAGAETLLQLVERGDASQRVLGQAAIRDKITASKSEAIQQRFQKLVAGMPPALEEADKLIEERRKAFASAKPDIHKGRTIFSESCSVCHQVGGQGKVVGPQLDGIGNRGLERLLEDILDPNRNVDVNFRTTVVTMKDGEVVSGLTRREEGAALVIADAGGNESQVPLNQIAGREQTSTSLMPANFGEALTPEQFTDLLGYLLNLRN